MARSTIMVICSRYSIHACHRQNDAPLTRSTRWTRSIQLCYPTAATPKKTPNWRGIRCPGFVGELRTNQPLVSWPESGPVSQEQPCAIHRTCVGVDPDPSLSVPSLSSALRLRSAAYFLLLDGICPIIGSLFTVYPRWSILFPPSISSGDWKACLFFFTYFHNPGRSTWKTRPRMQQSRTIGSRRCRSRKGKSKTNRSYAACHTAPRFSAGWHVFPHTSKITSSHHCLSNTSSGQAPVPRTVFVTISSVHSSPTHPLS